MENILTENILVSGYLYKKSRYLRLWKKRWFIIYPLCLYTFKQPNKYEKPTEVIEFRQILNIVVEQTAEDQKCACIITNQREYRFICETDQQLSQFIGNINRYMTKFEIQD